MSQFRVATSAVMLLAGFMVVSAVSAQERDGGIAALIAAQGNEALRTIRAESRVSLLEQIRPVLPALPRAEVVRRPAAPGAVVAATMRCAK